MQYPLLMISKVRRDQRGIWVKYSRETGCLQLRYVLLKKWRVVDVIDAGGNFYENSKICPSGVSWRLYKSGGPIGLILSFFNLIFMTLAIDYDIITSGDGRKIDLNRAKKIILNSAKFDELKRNRAKYRSLVHKVGAAKNFDKLFDSVGSWWD